MYYPKTRLRRLRNNKAVREMVQENRLSRKDLIYPLFVKRGTDIKEPIASLDDCFHFSPDKIVSEALEVYDLGIPAVLLFGLPSEKDELGSEAWSENAAVQQSIKRIKDKCPELVIITDVCLCAYTNSGHCGKVEGKKILNDESCELLSKVALSHGNAGADIVAPSDMMDGRVKHIRETLDENGLNNVAIMSYAAKFASSFYGPFRGVADSSPAFGDRKSYQMDIANSEQAIREIELDIQEGADFVMVKPSLCFLDIIYRAKNKFSAPIAAYNVSGEYMMIKNAAANGIIDENECMRESLLSIKRAGADLIITYFAKKAVELNAVG